MAERLDLYAQDIIAPTAVHHLVEFGDTDPSRPGEFGFWYNFIDYHFEDGDASLSARHYLDETNRAHLMAWAADDDFTLKVLVFLIMRFDTLAWLVTDAGFGPVPDEVMALVRQRRDAHLAASAV